MNITTVGIDLAKNILQVHGVDERGKPVLRKSLKWSHVPQFVKPYVKSNTNGPPPRFQTPR
jgi:hypothetical protein